MDDARAAGQGGLGRPGLVALTKRELAGVRTVVLVSADAGLRGRLRATLIGLRWQVREANGVRVIAATHQPLEQRAEEGLFRLDLYHRLAVFPIEVPALRERMQDLSLLIEYFLEAMGHEMPRKRISAPAVTKLMGYRWPGNVRELMHVLERGAILTGDRSQIEAEDIRMSVRRAV